MGRGAAGSAEPRTVQRHLHTLQCDLKELCVNLGIDGISAMGGQTFVLQVLISLSHYTSFLLASLDSPSKLSLAFLKSQLLPACPTTHFLTPQPTSPSSGLKKVLSLQLAS